MERYFERLQYIAREKKIDQIDLARGTATSPATINKWWNGKRVPGAKNTRLLAEFFGCDIGWLATGEGEPFPKSKDATYIAQETTGDGDSLIISDVGQINDSSFMEKAPKQSTLSKKEILFLREQLKELKELQEWKRRQEQRVTMSNYNLRLIVEWMDTRYSGENEVQSILHFNSMMETFDDFKDFVEEKLKNSKK